MTANRYTMKEALYRGECYITTDRWCATHSTANGPVYCEPRVYDCGHRHRVPGCGGCDPGAIEYVIEDGTRTLRPYDPARDDLSPINSNTLPPWPCCGAQGEHAPGCDHP